MDIDFIKWMIGYAEGFELSEMSTDQIRIEIIDIEKVVSFSTMIAMGKGDPESNKYWQKIYYPLLLQRAIEGVNRGESKYWIIQHRERIIVRKEFLDGLPYFRYEDISPDQAKEATLKYIYKQESKNEIQCM